MRILTAVLLITMCPTFTLAQDLSPLRDHLVWLPMTGVTEAQMDDAVTAGYDAMMLKIHPPIIGDASGGVTGVDFASTDAQLALATGRGLKLVLPILGWVGLGDGQFWDVEEDGKRVPNQLDPFWPEAMARAEWYYGEVIDHYKANPHVIAFAPTWGIYGEAGFTSWQAGRSPHALARFNEWRADPGLAPLDALPTRAHGPNTEFNQFIRFRFLYIEDQFDAMVGRLKQRAGTLPVGMWQELYPVLGYLWNMVEVPSADFGLYESAFPFQTTHHPEKCLAETMGVRYQCENAEEYRDYYLPLLARKRGEGQGFMGCQLSNDYAKNFGWSATHAVEAGFDQWEDRFAPDLKRLLDTPLEEPVRDVLLVFPTYAAAALSDRQFHQADAWLIDVMLRQYGCQMARYGSPRLDKMTQEEMNRFRLIVIPSASYLMTDTLDRLAKSTATVLFTGCFGQALDGTLTPFGGTGTVDRVAVGYDVIGPATVTISMEGPLSEGLRPFLPIHLPEDEVFRYTGAADADIVLSRGDTPLLSTRRDGRIVYIHGHLFAGAAWDPERKPPELAGSADPSANLVDMWGPYSSTHPQNAFAMRVLSNVLDYAGVDYRVPFPAPRTLTPYLADNMEPASISANLVYNNMPEPATVMVRLPWKPRGMGFEPDGDHFLGTVTVPPFSYVALQQAK